MDDREFLKGLKADRENALEAVIDTYSPYVTTVLRNQLGEDIPWTEVEELASEVFFTLWQKRHTILTTHLRGWLSAVARNCARSFLRKRKRESGLVSLEEVILVTGDKAAALLEAEERTRVLNLALEELGERDKEIFLWYYREEASVSTIARHLSMNPEAVKSRLRRGRIKLKEILQREGYEL